MKEYIYEMPRDDYDNMFSDKAGNPTVGEQYFYGYDTSKDTVQVVIPEKLKQKMMTKYFNKVNPRPVLVDVFNYTDTDIDDDTPEWNDVDSYTLHI